MAIWRADRARTSQVELTVEKGVSGNETAMGVKEVRPEYGRKGRPAAGRGRRRPGQRGRDAVRPGSGTSTSPSYNASHPALISEGFVWRLLSVSLCSSRACHRARSPCWSARGAWLRGTGGRLRAGRVMVSQMRLSRRQWPVLVDQHERHERRIPLLPLGEAPRDRDWKCPSCSAPSCSVPARLTCQAEACRTGTSLWSHSRSRKRPFPYRERALTCGN
jgi:hypothetical protein